MSVITTIDAPRSRRRIGPKTIFVLLLLLALTAGYLKHSWDISREALHKTLCKANLFKLAFAMHQYREQEGCFPPAYVADVQGKPMHSWRTLILPYVDRWDYDAQQIHSKYKFDEPWDSPHNSSLVRPVERSRFACPSGRDAGTIMTNYVVVIGPHTLFPGAPTISREALPKSAEDTLILLEISGSNIPWLEPRDLSIDDLTDETLRTLLKSPHGGFIRYITVNGQVKELDPETVTVDEIRRLANFSK